MVVLIEYIRLFFYVDGQEVHARNALQKFMLMVHGFGAETERERITSRTREALTENRKPKAVEGSKTVRPLELTYCAECEWQPERNRLLAGPPLRRF